MNWIGLIFVAAGLFALCGGIFNWDWFMNHRKAQFLINLVSRTGARIFYAVFGLAFVVFGILFILGIIKDSN